MNIVAKITEIMPKVTGEGKNGTWQKQDFIVETDGQYPQNICFTVWGDKIDVSRFEIGARYSVDFDASSRRYNDRWFTELKAWKVAKEQGNSENGGGAPMTENDFPPVEHSDDLPF
jgi:hypothetical protein